MSAFDDRLGNPAAAVMTESSDGGDALTVEFNCGRVRGWLDVQDGMFGRKIVVWLYDKPTNRKVGEWAAE